MTIKKLISIFLFSNLLFTISACEKTTTNPTLTKKEKSVNFPKHPGSIKMVDMYDKTTEVIPIDEVPKWNQFIYYDNNGDIVDNIPDAVKAIPIVEERMTPTLDGKIVSPDKADFIKIEVVGADGKVLRRKVIPQRQKK